VHRAQESWPKAYEGRPETLDESGAGRRARPSAPAGPTTGYQYMPPHVVAVRRVQHQNRRGAGQNCGTAHFGGVPRKGAPTLRKPCFYALRSKNFGLEIALQGRQKDMKVRAISIMAQKEDLVYHYNQRKVVWFRPQAMRVYSWKH
jgi:hypothetical protein